MWCVNPEKKVLEVEIELQLSSLHRCICEGAGCQEAGGGRGDDSLLHRSGQHGGGQEEAAECQVERRPPSPLWSRYNFTCSCEVCSLPEDALAKNDKVSSLNSCVFP